MKAPREHEIELLLKSYTGSAAAKDKGGVNVQVKALDNVRESACGDCHKVFRADFRKGGGGKI